MASGLPLLVAAGLAVVVFRLVVAARDGIEKLKGAPGKLHWSFLSPFNFIVLLLGPRFPPRGWFAYFDGRFSQYAKEGTTILSGLLFGSMTPVFLVADVEGMKQITSDRHTFVKDLSSYEHVNIYGRSLVSTDGNEWRRHLAVAGPAFSESNNAMVWRETRRLVQEWFKTEYDMETPGSTTKVDVLAKMTQATLHVIAAAGFGIRANWSAFSDPHVKGPALDAVRQKGDSVLLPFHTALEQTLTNLFVRMLAPAFMYTLPFRVPVLSDTLAIASAAFTSLKTHMARMVESVKNGEEVEENAEGLEHEELASDLLKRLVQANEAEKKGKGKGSLTEGEVYSNVFMFLLAGHETSAHTLTFAFLMLAMYPDVQHKLREESFKIWPTENDVDSSNYRTDFEKFEYTLAFFREVLRCFPIEPRLQKLTSCDTTLTATVFEPKSEVTAPKTTYDGSINHVTFERDEKTERKVAIAVPKDSIVMMDIWGLHMNPMVWGPDAHEFRPTRFIDTADYKWPRDGFMTFSAGARGCVGKTFALTEAIVILSLLVRNFELFPAVPADSTHKTREELRRRMLGYSTALTIGPNTRDVVFRRYVRGEASEREADA